MGAGAATGRASPPEDANPRRIVAERMQEIELELQLSRAAARVGVSHQLRILELLEDLQSSLEAVLDPVRRAVSESCKPKTDPAPQEVLDAVINAPFTVRSRDSLQQGDQCVICCETYTLGETLSRLPGCRHVFHPGCISQWLANASKCPICRCDLKEAVGFEDPGDDQQDAGSDNWSPDAAASSMAVEPEQPPGASAAPTATREPAVVPAAGAADVAPAPAVIEVLDESELPGVPQIPITPDSAPRRIVVHHQQSGLGSWRLDLHRSAAAVRQEEEEQAARQALEQQAPQQAQGASESSVPSTPPQLRGVAGFSWREHILRTATSSGGSSGGAGGRGRNGPRAGTTPNRSNSHTSSARRRPATNVAADPPAEASTPARRTTRRTTSGTQSARRSTSTRR
mmetsp:Transcript_3594/g.7462  ORF Transcript_3594/g.7462 Transcript_3594/m.7462 type:complete len:400 (-) Transcript_3594:147-1346(-)